MVRGVLLLTGATGRVGAALLPLLVARGRARALPGARPAAPRSRPRAGPARARRPRRSGLVPPRAARRPHRRPPRRLVARPAARRGSRSSTASRSLRLVRGGRARRRRALRHALAARRPPAAPAPRLPGQGRTPRRPCRRAAMQATILRASAIHGRARAPPAAARRRAATRRSSRSPPPTSPPASSPRSTGPGCTSSPARRPCAGARSPGSRRGHRPLRVPPPLLRPALRGYETLAGPRPRS